MYPGKHVFFDTLVRQGVRYLFGNPGTTESPLIDGLLDVPQVTYVMALHEGVALGAAHYYAQATGQVGVVNLHVAPGLGNALGMLYNAKEAYSPLLVTAGQQDTRMRLREPLLSDDLVELARPLVKWSVQAERADELALLLHRAFKVATDPPSGPVFVALPIDVLEQRTASGALEPSGLYRRALPEPAALEHAARLLLLARRPALVVGDGVARAGAQQALVALAERAGAPVWLEGLLHQLVMPNAHPLCRTRLPFDAAGIRKALSDSDLVVLAGGNFFEEVWFNPGDFFPAGARIVQLEETPPRLARNFRVDVGVVGCLRASLEALVAAAAAAGAAYTRAAQERAETLGAERAAELRVARERAKEVPAGHPPSPAAVMAALAGALPGDAIVVNEAITATPDVQRHLRFAQPGSYYGTRGGGIGQALPGALGVKLAHPERPVVAVSGDGSAMYSIQALWTAAHHRLAVVFVILHNREYRILKHNLDLFRQRFDVASGRGYLHMDLTEPELDFAGMARAMGVAAEAVRAADALPEALARALASGQPYLLDVAVAGFGG